jgi:cytochrome c oxidase subunit II
VTSVHIVPTDSGEQMTSPRSRGSRLRRITLPLAAGAGLLVTGCARNSPQDTWQPAGPDAQTIDNLQRPVFMIAAVVGVLVFVAVIVAVVKFKDRGQPIPAQGHGNPIIEIGGIMASAIILAAIAVPTVATVFKLADTDGCELTVNVTGQQWWWEYSYPAQDGIPEPIVTSGQLVMPAGECVLLRITSRDVIHSFWIPKLNGKRDAVPNRIHTLRMEADEPGMYAGQCTEFCGLSHANMKMDAVALDGQDFATWVTRQIEDAPPAAVDTQSEAGQEVFIAQCVRCHQINGLENADGEPLISQADQNLVAGAAPNLTHLMSRTTFAGGTFDLLNPVCRERLQAASSEEFGALYLDGTTPECLNRVELEAWLRNPPLMKPMYPQPNAEGLGRGMPYLGLTEVDIDKLVEYLVTMK